jgi:antitoxin (DNA-binding transcriptional repressor) of toxin-antitoxin stability system
MKVNGEQARNRWRDMVDHAFKGGEVIVQRYDKPVAVLVNYDAWQIWKKQRIAFLMAQSAEIDAGNFFTHEQVLAGMRERGLLD